jgi:hypothetical protein
LQGIYSSAQGRFTSVDPENAGATPDDPQSWNGYAFARSNPLFFVDPDGQKFVVCNPDGSCGEISDDDFYAERKKFEALGFKFTGNRDFFEGGNIISPEGQVVASYQQTEIDLTGPNGRARLLAYELRERFDDPSTYVRAAIGAALGAALRSQRRFVPKGKSVGAMRRLDYEASPKHGATARGRISKAPTNGQEALDTSVQVKATSPRRVGVDPQTGEYVVFDQTSPGKFHGHVRTWNELTPEMKRALTDSGMTSKGKP